MGGRYKTGEKKNASTYSHQERKKVPSRRYPSSTVKPRYESNPGPGKQGKQMERQRVIFLRGDDIYHKKGRRTDIDIIREQRRNGHRRALGHCDRIANNGGGTSWRGRGARRGEV